MKNVGSKCILRCAFDLKKLGIKFICIQGKSVFCEALFNKGMITLEDLTTGKKWCHHRLSNYGKCVIYT